MKVCLAPFRLLWTPYLGGHSWVYINWALGIQENGCEIILLESYLENEKPAEALQKLEELHGHLKKIGLRAEISLLLSEEQHLHFKHIKRELDELIHEYEMKVVLATFKELHCAFLLAQRIVLEGH